MKSSRQNHRRSLRLNGYDYSQPAGYFVTICTHNRVSLFGAILNGEVQLNETVKIAHALWAELPGRFPQIEMDKFVVMPNHIHAIILVAAQFIAPLAARECKIPGDANHRRHTLGEIIRAYKAVSARRIRRLAPEFMWQRNYYDHIIRNEDSLNRIRQYIIDNPARWQFDRENPAAIMLEPEPFAAVKRAH